MSDEHRSSELALERLALGELPPAQEAALRARLGDAVEPRLAALRRSSAEILAAHPPALVRVELERRDLRQVRTSTQRILWLALPLATAALAALVLWPEPPVDAPRVATRELPRHQVDETRIKGLEPHLVLHRQEGERTVQLAAPAQARARDRLQISYVAATARHGVVLSIDGGGLVTLHHPARLDGSTSLQQGGVVALPQSYELDAAPAFERFLLVTADDAIDPARVLAAARELAASPTAASDPLPLPAEWRQYSFLVRKVAP